MCKRVCHCGAAWVAMCMWVVGGSHATGMGVGAVKVWLILPFIHLSSMSNALHVLWGTHM